MIASQPNWIFFAAASHAKEKLFSLSLSIGCASVVFIKFLWINFLEAKLNIYFCDKWKKAKKFFMNCWWIPKPTPFITNSGHKAHSPDIPKTVHTAGRFENEITQVYHWNSSIYMTYLPPTWRREKKWQMVIQFRHQIFKNQMRWREDFQFWNWGGSSIQKGTSQRLT